MSFSNFISSKTELSPTEGLTRWIIRLGIITAATTTAIMILASSVINGFQNEIEKKIFGFWGHVDLSNAAMTTQYESHPMTISDTLIAQIESLDQVQLTDRMGEVFTTNAGVSYVQSSALLPGIITTGEGLEGIILKGLDKDFNPQFFDQYLREGEALQISDEVNHGAIVSQQTALRLNLQLHDPLELLFVINNKQFPRKFTIEGIYRTGLEEYDRKFILVDIKRIRQLLKWEPNQVGSLEVFLEDVSDAPLMADYIYYELLTNEQYAESVKDKYPGIFEWLELQSVNEWVILGLMLLVCILNMITILLILILEKTGMIGILKSLGATNWSIRKIFISHGTRILIKGLIWGNVIGLGLAFIQNQFKLMPMNEEDYYLAYVPIQFDFLFILAINAGTILIVMLCLLIPSALIARIDPVKALRFQ